jgi:hypothetical protein
MRHLSPELLIDLAEGTRPESSAGHLAECGECRQQLADLREMMAVAVSAEMPEPSPLFWDHLSARVRTAVAEDVEHPASWTRVLNARVCRKPRSDWRRSGAGGGGEHENRRCADSNREAAASLQWPRRSKS